MPSRATLNRLEAELLVDGGRTESHKDANRNLEDILEELLVLADRSGLDFDDSLDAARRYYTARRDREAADAAGQQRPAGEGRVPAGAIAGLPEFEE